MKPTTLAVPPLRCFLIPPAESIGQRDNLPLKHDNFAISQL